MAFKQAFGKCKSWLPLSHSKAALAVHFLFFSKKKKNNQKPLHSNEKCNEQQCLVIFFFICPLIDEMRQVLWVMAFIKLTWMHSAPEPLVVRLPPRKKKKKLQFPDLLRQAAVGVTFSYAKTAVHNSKVWPCTNVKGRNKHMPLWNSARNRKGLFISTPLAEARPGIWLQTRKSAELPTRNITKMLTLLHKGV